MKGAGLWLGYVNNMSSVLLREDALFIRKP